MFWKINSLILDLLSVATIDGSFLERDPDNSVLRFLMLAVPSAREKKHLPLLSIGLKHLMTRCF